MPGLEAVVLEDLIHFQDQTALIADDIKLHREQAALLLTSLNRFRAQECPQVESMNRSQDQPHSLSEAIVQVRDVFKSYNRNPDQAVRKPELHNCILNAAAILEDFISSQNPTEINDTTQRHQDQATSLLDIPKRYPRNN